MHLFLKDIILEKKEKGHVFKKKTTNSSAKYKFPFPVPRRMMESRTQHPYIVILPLN